MSNVSLRKLLNEVDAVKNAGMMQKAVKAERAMDRIVDVLIEQQAEINRLNSVIQGGV